jgi:energy-coupling factor transporter ATP-binding protein EcfA2
MTPETKTWLNSQHAWIQEATYRLLTNGKVEQADIDDFVALIKAPPVIAPGAIPTPRTYPTIGVGPATTDELHLVSIGDISGIDNLAPRLPLTFGSGNLSVAYGRNGSGKSGYTRILKKVSGKSGAVDLKPNVYEPEPETRKCTITYRLNGTETPQTWEANSAPLADLSAIDIFDSASGRVYLESETEVSYKPAELALYSDLVDVCNRVEAALEAEQVRLISSLPAIAPKFEATQIATLYGSLRATANEATLTSQFEWTGDDEKSLEELTAKLQVSDPAAAAIKQRAVKREIDALKSSIETALAAVAPEACTKIKELAAASGAARTAARGGAQALNDSSELTGIGSETWRALWEAAREYSTTEAYPDDSYPNVDGGARCVLCHQELGEVPGQRLAAFEEYVSGTLESAAQEAEGLASNAIDALPIQPSDEELQTACQAAELTEDCLESLKATWAEVQGVSDALRTNPLNDETAGLATEDHPLIIELTKRSEACEQHAAAYDKDVEEFDRTAARAAVLELEAKQWASQQLDAVKAEVDRLKQVVQYAEWRRQTQAGRVSHQAGRVSNTLITKAYVARFNAELVKLGAKGICVELVKTRVEHGEVKHRIQLRELVSEGTKISEILSEGEHRIVSLAGFLADVTAQASNVPFVFDDPISSLDHEYEWKVATRLVELAQTRQVIVLTHRLSLYGGVEDAAKKVEGDWKKDNLWQSCIERFAGTTGHPVDQSTWNANTKTANNILITRLQDATKAWDAGDSPLYSVHAQAICSDFRKLLERTIEKDLLSEVVLRHRRSITTEGRLPKLAKISSEDCVYFDVLMTKYSCFEHSQSQETPVTLPEEPELRADVEGLKAWRVEFTARQ